MLRALLRAGGYVLLAAAFVFAVMDGARSLANGAVSLTPLGASLARLAPQKFQQLPALVGRLNPKLWDPVLIDALFVPTSLALALLGLLLASAAARGRRER